MTIHKLNIFLSDLNTLSIKIRNYHWFVKGENFFVLHEEFQKIYNEINKYIDEVAERLLAINETPLATMEEYLQNSLIIEAKKQVDAHEMITILSNDFKYIQINLKSLIDELQDDAVTQDMIISMLSYFDKKLWMFNSYLKYKI